MCGWGLIPCKRPVETGKLRCLLQNYDYPPTTGGSKHNATHWRRRRNTGLGRSRYCPMRINLQIRCGAACLSRPRSLPHQSLHGSMSVTAPPANFIKILGGLPDKAHKCVKRLLSSTKHTGVVVLYDVVGQSIITAVEYFPKKDQYSR